MEIGFLPIFGGTNGIESCYSCDCNCDSSGGSCDCDSSPSNGDE